MDNASTRDIFQYVLLGIFGIVAGLSVVYLATFKSDKSKVVIDYTPVIIWGPAFGDGERTMPDAMRAIVGRDEAYSTLQYVEKNPTTLYQDLIEAIAQGAPPDLLFFDAASLMEIKSQLQPISYESLSLRDFRDTYVEGAEVFAMADNIYALPILVDPLVLYWNRDLFTNALVTQVPTDWDTFVQVAPRLSRIERGADLTQSGVALGEYDNVRHAREIMATLLMQSGTPLVSFDGKVYKSVMNVKREGGSNPALALSFYTDFSNPRKTVYSWNKTFPESREAFAANKVAMYAGFASEAPTLTFINPNLNFDVALWPQSARGHNKVTYGKFYGLAVVKHSVQVQRALSILSVLSTEQATDMWSKYSGIPPTRRTMLGAQPTDPFAEVLARSAIIARSWHTPHSGGFVDDIFSQMITDVTSGKETPDKALQQASTDLNVLLEKYNKTTE
jgi:ABC-type glycerol-3-phosphate transport system substrate-binding protein